MNPLIGLALAHAEKPSLHHLQAVGLQIRQQEEQPIFRRRQRAGLVDGEATGGAWSTIKAPTTHMRLESCLERRDQDLKLLQSEAGEIQELRGAEPHISEP